MLKNLSTGAAAAALTLLSMTAGADILQGDIAFTSFNADEDGWSIVALADIAANTTIYFRDDEWNGSSFNTGEGIHTWNSGGSLITAGTVIRFSSVDQAARSASIGTLTSTGDTGINATSETIYAYHGTSTNAPTTFLAGVSTEGTANLAPAGLTSGVNAVVITNSADYGEYTGVRTGLSAFDLYAGLINDSANWNVIVGGDQATVCLTRRRSPLRRCRCRQACGCWCQASLRCSAPHAVVRGSPRRHWRRDEGTPCAPQP